MTAMARPSRGWLGITLMLALTGVTLGISLTRTKLRQIGTPCLEPSDGCPLSEQASCGDVLASPWSMWLEQPLSLWAAAFYVVIATLTGLLLLRPRALAGCAPHLLLTLAVVDVLVSLVMASYSRLVLGTFCTYCIALYIISVLVLICADAVYRGLTRDHVVSWRQAWRLPGARLDAFFLSSMVFVYAAGVQMLGAQRWLAAANPSQGCPPVLSVPRTDLVFGAPTPDVLLVVFLDPSCKSCKRKYGEIVALSNEGLLGDAQIRVMLAPRDACDDTSFPEGFPGASDEARNENACLAALAVECVERSHPRKGTALLSRLYARHDVPAPSPLFTLETIAAEARHSSIGVDIGAGEVHACMNEDAAARRIAEHQLWLFDLWKDVAAERRRYPVIMLIPVRDGIPDLAVTQYVPTNATKPGLVRQLAELREQKQL